MDVRDNPDLRRYEVVEPGGVVGFTEYRLSRGRMAFVHTEVVEAAAGRGIGKIVVTAALDAARERGLEVWPLCPFVRGFIERNPAYLELVPVKQRERLGLGGG